MDDSQNIGIFKIETVKLKDTFLPSPLNCLKSIHDLLPVLAKERTDSLFTDLNDAVKKLSSTPTTVEHFVQFLGYMETISKNMDDIEARYGNVTDLYKLLDDEHVNVPPDEKERYTIHTVSTISTLRHTLSLNDEGKEQSWSLFDIMSSPGNNLLTVPLPSHINLISTVISRLIRYQKVLFRTRSQD